jgi:murein L,D-transpeptidase YcbB/YkuD
MQEDQEAFKKKHCHFDKNIRKLVKKFQKKKKLEDSGVVDQVTWSKIMKTAANCVFTSTKRQSPRSSAMLRDQSVVIDKTRGKL